MDFRALNGVVLHVQDLGAADKPALVFANSLGTDLRIWDDVVARLADRFRIVLYDKRGHGLSEVDKPPYSIADHVGDLAALLDDLAIEGAIRSEAHTSELQSLMRISYAVFCLKKK